jgi:hypothetical protein
MDPDLDLRMQKRIPSKKGKLSRKNCYIIKTDGFPVTLTLVFKHNINALTYFKDKITIESGGFGQQELL